MINLEKKIEELTEKYGEPGKGAEGRYLHERKALDPEGLGRVRVSTDMSVPGSESPWLCVAGQWKKKGSGWWVLPEIGTQALVVYTAKDRSRGYVLGYIYDRKHLPPERGRDSGTVVLEGKKVRGEIREGRKRRGNNHTGKQRRRAENRTGQRKGNKHKERKGRYKDKES